MIWHYKLDPEAEKDFNALDGSQKKEVLKAIRKVIQNPLPFTEGGYGKPLGNKNGNNLTGYYKIKLKKSGIRIVYELIHIDNNMYIIVIGMRSDQEVYAIAQKRIHKHFN